MLIKTNRIFEEMIQSFYTVLPIVLLLGMNQLSIGQTINDSKKSEFVFSDFKQVKPDLGTMPSNKTIVTISWDESILYVKVEAYHSSNNDIYSSSIERDLPMEEDDHVDIVLDTYNDGTNALMFRTNSIGNKLDCEYSNNGNEFNYNWNTFWDVSTSITSNGWIAQFEIPFSSLRFKKAQEIVMGLKVVRFIKSTNETVIFPLKDESQFEPLFDCVNMKEIRINGVKQKKPLYFSPYIAMDYYKLLTENDGKFSHKSKFIKNNNYASNSTFDKTISNIGFDLKFKPLNNHTIDLTVNTDFAQAEADDRIINLTRFSVALPEKRSFFLENKEAFSANMFYHSLFHSRNVGIEDGEYIPIIGGARATGGTSKYNYGFLSMVTGYNHTGDIKPKSYSVLRFKKGLNNQESYIGFIITNKQEIDSLNYNRTIAIDGIYALGKTARLSYTMGLSLDSAHITNDNLMYGARFCRFQSKGYVFDYRYREYRQNYNPEMGYITVKNNKRLTLNQGYRFHFKNSKHLSTYKTGLWLTKHWESSTNRPEYFLFNTYHTIVGQKGHTFSVRLPLYIIDRLYRPWNISDSIIIPEGKYNMLNIYQSFASGNSKIYQYDLSATFGEYYGGKRFFFVCNYSIDAGRHIKFSAGINYNYIKFPTNYSLKSSILKRNLIRGRVDIFFNKKLSIKNLIQYDNHSKTVGINSRLRYHPKDVSDLYLVFNQSNYIKQTNEFNNRPSLLSQNIILKYTYTFKN